MVEKSSSTEKTCREKEYFLPPIWRITFSTCGIVHLFFIWAFESRCRQFAWNLITYVINSYNMIICNKIRFLRSSWAVGECQVWNAFIEPWNLHVMNNDNGRDQIWYYYYLLRDGSAMPKTAKVWEVLFWSENLYHVIVTCSSQKLLILMEIW